MHRCLGASRDPFEETRDPAVAWEPAIRARIREAAAEALRGGRGVWLRGAAGSGRGWLLARLAGQLAEAGRRVLFREGPAPEVDLGVLEALLEVTGPMEARGDLLDRAGELYRRLLEAFAASGPTVVVPATQGPLPPDALAELRLLAALRLAGHPLVVLALAGEGPAPVEGLVEVALPAPSAGDLRAFLAHRAAACGCPGLLSDRELAPLARAAGGFREALELARRAVARRVFHLPDARRVAAPAGAAASVGGVLHPDDLGEVDRLLAELEPGPAVPESF